MTMEERCIQYGKLVLLAAILFLMLFCCHSAKAQNPSVLQPNCSFGFTFTAAGRSLTLFNNITPLGVASKACSSWTLVYSSTGFSALSIELDEAPDNGATPGVSPGSWVVWPSAQVAAGQVLPSTTTSSAGITAFGFFPWVSVNLNSVTGTGQITGWVYGWTVQGSQESNTGATQTQGVAAPGTSPSGNPVQVALNSPTNSWSCALAGLANTLTQCQAAAAAGQRAYITDITVDTTTATAGTFLVETGTGANCGTGTAALYPASAPSNWSVTAPVLGAPLKLSFQTPLKAPVATAVCVIGTTTNTINIDLRGFFAP